MRSVRSCPRNFSDELYIVFRLKRTTALKENDLIATFKKKYGRLLNTKMLKKIPFIQIKKDESDIDKNIYYLVTELDDCCKEYIECKSKDCPLLHLLNANHKFNMIYPQFTGLNDRTIIKARAKISSLQLPTITLKERLTNILNTSKTNPKQMTFNQIQKIHNKIYPQFKWHQPTLSGIYLRFASTFMVRNNEKYNDGNSLILFNQNLPDQTDKYYISISISPQCTDQSLIHDLIPYIQQKTNIKIMDIYVKNMECLGFFTTSSKSVVNALLAQAKHPRILTCNGRKIFIQSVSNQYKNGYRVKVQNLPCTFNFNYFRDWIYNMTDTLSKTDLIYDVVVTFPKKKIESECIMVFNNKKDTRYIIQQIGNMSFRGFSLQFKYWNHPFNQDMQLNNEDNECVNGQSVLKENHDPNICNNNGMRCKFSDIVSRITPDTIKKSLFILEYTISNEIKSEQEIEGLICLILEHAIKNNVFIDEYVKLITYLPQYCVTVGYDEKGINKMIVNSTYLLFSKSKDNKNCDKNSFFGVMELIGQLYNVRLFKRNLIYKGVLKHLLPKQNGKISKTNVEGLCRLFIKCGKGLTIENPNEIDKYLQRLIIIQKKVNNDRIILLIDNVMKLRDNEWIINAQMEMYNILQDKYMEIVSKQQIEMNVLMDEYKWMKESEILKEKYNELEMNQETRMKVDVNIYILCNTIDFVDWITNLNKCQYSKYE
eukprot:477438_1